METLQSIYSRNSNLNRVATIDGGDKGTAHSYIKYYEKWFTPFREKSINFLEIGVAMGTSLRMWEEYFPNGTIYGVDIIDRKNYSTERTKVFQADATKPEFLELFKNISFDIVIDDGAHTMISQVDSFRLIYPKLNPGALYIIEDIFPPIEWTCQSINQVFDNQFKIYDLRSERPNQGDNVLMVYNKV